MAKNLTDLIRMCSAVKWLKRDDGIEGSKITTVTKTMIDAGVSDIFEDNPKCRITMDRVDIMLHGKRSKSRYIVHQKQLQSCCDFIFFDDYNKSLFVYFSADAHVFVPTVSVGLKLIKSIFNVYNYKTENVLPYSVIAEIVGLTYREFMSTHVDDRSSVMSVYLLDYPDIVESVCSTYSEETLIMNGICFFGKNSEIVMSVQKSFGMFNANV